MILGTTIGKADGVWVRLATALGRRQHIALVMSAAALFGASAARADLATSLMLQPTSDAPATGAEQAAKKPAVAAEAQGSTLPESVKLFGDAGYTSLTLAGNFGSDLESDFQAGVTIGWSTFVAPKLEMGVELGGWYFNLSTGTSGQESTGGGTVNFVGRWHFWMPDSPADRSWSVFAEARFGLAGTFDDVPFDGTSFNFTPAAGVGYTRDIGDGVRLITGVRWFHMSNARLTGNSNNPGLDSLMGYVGVMIPLR